MTSVFSWQNSISLCPASFCTPRPSLPVTPGVSWLPTFAFQSPIMKRTSFLGVSSSRSLGLHRTIQLQHCLTQCKPCHVGPPKTDESWWRGLIECHSLEKGMANHFSILASRTPWTVWKGKKIGQWMRNSPGWWVPNMLLLLLSRFSRVRLVATPWTSAYQAPLSMRFSRQEYCSGVPSPSPICTLTAEI